MTHTHRDFFHDLLLELDLPVRTSGLRAMACVNIFENSQGNLRWNNPLATVNHWPGSVNLYPDTEPCAQIYPTFRAGVHAEAALFAQPHWDGVRKAIKRHHARGPILAAFSKAYTWASIDFRAVDWNTRTALDTRLDHHLLRVLSS